MDYGTTSFVKILLLIMQRIIGILGPLVPDAYTICSPGKKKSDVKLNFIFCLLCLHTQIIIDVLTYTSVILKNLMLPSVSGTKATFFFFFIFPRE